MAKQSKAAPAPITQEPNTGEKETQGAMVAPDKNSPAAMKVKAAKQQAAEEPETYEVLKTQIIDGKWVSPAEKGKPPVTVDLLEVQARFRVLNGKLKKASKTSEKEDA